MAGSLALKTVDRNVLSRILVSTLLDFSSSGFPTWILELFCKVVFLGIARMGFLTADPAAAFARVWLEFLWGNCAAGFARMESIFPFTWTDERVSRFFFGISTLTCCVTDDVLWIAVLLVAVGNTADPVLLAGKVSLLRL